MKKPLLIAATFGVIAALFTALYFNSIEAAYKKGAQKVTVLIARQYIDQGTIIDEMAVEEKLVPKEYLQPRAVQSVKDLVNDDGKRTFMSTVPIEKGEQLITTKLSLLGIDTGLSAIIPNEKRAITLILDGETVSGIIKPGNRVDIISIFEYQDKANQMQEAAITILQNTLVLSVGKSMLGTAGPAGKKSREQGSIAIPDIGASVPVSLALTPKEAEILTLASEKGRIKLALRPIGDDTLYQTVGTKIRDICNDISSTVSETGKPAQAVSEAMIKEMQNKQREVMNLLKKYQKQ